MCSYNQYCFIINNSTFLRLNLIKIIHQKSKYTRLHQSFQNSLTSKYKPQRFNCSMFSKISLGAKYPRASVYVYHNYFIYKNMFYVKICKFFGNFSRHNLNKTYTKTHHIFKIFSRELAYAPEPPPPPCQILSTLLIVTEILHFRGEGVVVGKFLGCTTMNSRTLNDVTLSTGFMYYHSNNFHFVFWR